MIGERLLFAPIHSNLRKAFVFFIIPFLYSQFSNGNQRGSLTIEEAMTRAWEKEIVKPGAGFKKVVVGFNCNVDLIVPGVNVIERLNTTARDTKSHEVIDSLTELHETFAHHFQRGAAAERFMSSEEAFCSLVRQAEATGRSQHEIGGNAAIMAERIASSFPATDVYLVGPIGPRSQALLHPAVKRTNSTRIVKDELHVILEYKQGEILADLVSPSSSRFVTSHDLFSGSTLVMEMLFKAVSQFKPDLVIVTGVHLLEFQEKEARMDKLQILRRNLLQISPKVPIHFELGSVGDASFVETLLNKIIPHVDSLGLNEQELAYLAHVAGGPHEDEFPIEGGTTHPHKVVDMLHWLMKNYGRNRKDPNSKNFGYRLQRIHFHCLTYHIMVSTGTDWSNLVSAAAAGARLAGRIACNIQDSRESDALEVRMSHSFPLDKQKGKMYNFDAKNPMASWLRDDVVFVFTPVLVCKFPKKTVGIDDAISATTLLYSQFYRFEHWNQ